MTASVQKTCVGFTIYENKMRDGGRKRALIVVEVWK